jgi:hypothetical protein
MVDVSRNVVAVLLILVVAVSVLGTLSFLNSASEAPKPQSQSAAVGLAILKPPRDDGQVVLSIVPNGAP